MRRFHPVDRDTDLLLPLSVQDWLSKGHLARYVVEVVEGLDLSALGQADGGTGGTPYHPAMLLALLVYGDATGCFSRRKIERAPYDALAFRFIACNLHPDHDTLATFRRRFRKEDHAGGRWPAVASRSATTPKPSWTLVCLARNLKRMAVLRPQ